MMIKKLCSTATFLPSALFVLSCQPYANESASSKTMSGQGQSSVIPLSPEMAAEIENCLGKTSKETCEQNDACRVIVDPVNSSQKLCSHRWIEIRANISRCGGTYDYNLRLPFVSKTSFKNCSAADTAFVAIGEFTNRLGKPEQLFVALDARKAPVAEGAHSCAKWSLKSDSKMNKYSLTPLSGTETESLSTNSNNTNSGESGETEVPELFQLCGGGSDRADPKTFSDRAPTNSESNRSSHVPAPESDIIPKKICPEDLDPFDCGSGDWSDCRYDTSTFPSRCVNK